LVRNRPSYSVCLLPYKLVHKEQVIENLCQIRTSLGEPLVTVDDIKTKLKQARKRPFEATILCEDVDLGIVSIIEEHQLELQGIVIQTELRREYPYGKLAAHLLGYVGEIPEEDFKKYQKQGYQQGDRLGLGGIERQYEAFFRGRDGYQFVEVNAYGKKIGVLDQMPYLEPVPGHDLWLTMDLDLQKTVESVFPESLNGAVVVIDPRNGEILAMLSSPHLDYNLFSTNARVRNKFWQTALQNPRLPLNNRAIQGLYAPGSTFKLVGAGAALNEGLQGEEEIMPISCTGGFEFGDRVFDCWEEKGHGKLKLVDAVCQSCDIFFYQLGLKVGIDLINIYARKFGFSRPTGIDLPFEAAGELMDEKTYNAKFKERGWRWTEGMVLNLVIGQGETATPIQLANMIAGIGNAGRYYRPFLLKMAVNAQGQIVAQTSLIEQHIEFNSLTIRNLQQSVFEAVNHPKGTGGWARLKDVRVGGKTGSAEHPLKDLTDALFVACAPYQNPEIALAVVVENAGHGGSVAAPIAGSILRSYFKQRSKV